MTKLTHEERKELPTGDFVFPKTRRYPIEDAAHARDALARSSGKPEHATVRLLVPDGYSPEDVKDLSSVLNALVADAFALYLKTKNFHWHMNGQHFRDYHLLLDEHATQIFGITDAIAERVRKVGGITIHSIGHIARLQRIADNDEEFVGPTEMLRELHADNKAFVESLRAAHVVTVKANDYATTSLIEVWIDEAERRAWFLFEATR